MENNALVLLRVRSCVFVLTTFLVSWKRTRTRFDRAARVSLSEAKCRRESVARLHAPAPLSGTNYILPHKVALLLGCNTLD